LIATGEFRKSAALVVPLAIEVERAPELTVFTQDLHRELADQEEDRVTPSEADVIEAAVVAEGGLSRAIDDVVAWAGGPVALLSRC